MNQNQTKIPSSKLSRDLRRWRTSNREIDRVVERELKFQPLLKRFRGGRSTRLEKLAALRDLYRSQAYKGGAWENIASMFSHVTEWERWVIDHVESAKPESISVELLMVAIQQRDNVSEEIKSICDFWREGVDSQFFNVKGFGKLL